ncbi:diaminohydroxyphosphoribosylaminopyrimidine deaminase / 5-amino-6-(5-phosphoribosylamino)uracil reductase [Mariprofundus micogutta]|uniref:Riboflavin biosynthesis protein RibD n=1 Tax=Mariprofundus micogutta TaxID=1921010 RepID=A0A1L8CQU9_9PROT|nr:bifunctional diaminohydroxyphosphoribosylaminopyrimidine deaminase/5-amino-6-(5-phosphoribosylamino)uracil reductase RibD [Mariprofundus micogutta]GAV21295.1 diaminohydroxyphosphoribosylaminopyrimidine deaminase / 5-amino-6-(5-phosphoribosylamino)uracil reductase [Mariprofundus micogutta]
MEVNQQCEALMARAIELARRGIGTTHPNPRVGAVVVNHGEIVGEGWHEIPGGPHAEVMALQQAGEKAKGGTIYVTLEPCAAYGRTPPCTAAIKNAGIKHLVYASSDPNPDMAGGSKVLQAMHVEVTAGVLRAEADELNRPFFHYIKTGRPYVIGKAAISLDGKLATRSHHSQWITGPESRAHAHAIRAVSDAIIVGAGTLKDDNPSLTVRDAEQVGDVPLRVALCFDTPVFNPDCKLLSDEAPSRLYVRNLNEYAQQWRDGGVEVLRADSLLSILQQLGDDGRLQLMLEGGGALHTSFLDGRITDEMVLYQAPMIIGGRDAVSLWGGHGIETISQAIRLDQVERVQLGNDQMIRGRVVYPE